MFCTATVRPKRSGPNILYDTSLKVVYMYNLDIDISALHKEPKTVMDCMDCSCSYEECYTNKEGLFLKSNELSGYFLRAVFCHF